MPELDELEVGESFADVAHSFVIEIVGMEVEGLEFCPTFKFRQGMTRDGEADKGESLQILKPGEML